MFAEACVSHQISALLMTFYRLIKCTVSNSLFATRLFGFISSLTNDDLNFLLKLESSDPTIVCTLQIIVMRYNSIWCPNNWLSSNKHRIQFYRYGSWKQIQHPYVTGTTLVNVYQSESHL